MPKSKQPRPAKDVEATAYHEAGHVVAALEMSLKFRHVEIGDAANRHGQVVMPPLPKWFLRDGIADDRSRMLIEKRSFCLLAGPFAESKYRGELNFNGMGVDLDHVLLMTGCIMSEAVKKKYLAYMVVRVVEFFEIPEAWGRVQAIAAALLERRKLRHVDVLGLLSARRLAAPDQDAVMLARSTETA